MSAQIKMFGAFIIWSVKIYFFPYLEVTHFTLHTWKLVFKIA